MAVIVFAVGNIVGKFYYPTKSYVIFKLCDTPPKKKMSQITSLPRKKYIFTYVYFIIIFKVSLESKSEC